MWGCLDTLVPESLGGRQLIGVIGLNTGGHTVTVVLGAGGRWHRVSQVRKLVLLSGGMPC